jgi:hypothetical protein
MSFTSAHNDYLDPDKHLGHGEDEERLTPQQKAQVTRLRREIDKLKSTLFDRANRTKVTEESLFECAPEGDFEWDGEPEDVGNAWNCGDSDCETGWHESVSCIEQGRKDGKTWFIILEDSIAGCGDYQPVAGWDEREGDTVCESILDDLWYHLQGRSIEHFAGWAEYDLDCAVTGTDPLGNSFTGVDNPPVEECLKRARNNVKILRNMVKRVRTNHNKQTKGNQNHD